MHPAAVSTAIADEKPAVALNEKEKAFSELLGNAVLVGNFTVNRQRPDKEGGRQNPERYGIKSVTKVSDGKWLVNSQIKYGSLDVTVPVPVDVHWANDTPVLSVTDLSIPLVGDEFTARVMFFDGQYAGTWRHGKVTGLMFGKIEKGDGEKPESKAADVTEKPAAKDQPQPPRRILRTSREREFGGFCLEK